MTGKQTGSTLMETLVALAIMGIGLGIGTALIRPDEAPLDEGAARVEALCRQARTSAIASASAYRIRPDATDSLLAERGASCSASTWESGGVDATRLPEGVSLTSTSWTVCFGRRGFSNANEEIRLQHADLGTIAVEVLRGGTTRVVD